MTAATTPLRVHIGPDPDPNLVEAISGSPIVLVEQDQAEAVIWLGSDPEQLRLTLSETNRWIQLRAAGVEQWVDAGVIDESRLWTSAAGAYSETVAEHAVALLLAGVRGLKVFSESRSWDREHAFAVVDGLHGSTVGVVGTGGIGSAIIRRLQPFGVRMIGINHSGSPVEGVVQTVRMTELNSVIDSIDHLILAAPDTPLSRGIVDSALLQKLKKNSWIVNVGRGSAIDEDALLKSLRSRSIGGAALDVVSAEPLPASHPFWRFGNVLVTPHVANPPAILEKRLFERIHENIINYIAGEPLKGVFSVTNGY